MSPEAHDRLVELDAVSRESLALYQYAAAVLPSSPWRDRCLRLEKAKAELVALLALRLRGGRPRSVAATRARALRERLAPAFVRARRASGASEASWRDGMAGIEADILDACRRAASGSEDADCRRVMAWVLPMLQRCRDEHGPGTKPE